MNKQEEYAMNYGLSMEHHPRRSREVLEKSRMAITMPLEEAVVWLQSNGITHLTIESYDYTVTETEEAASINGFYKSVVVDRECDGEINNVKLTGHNE